MDEILAGASVDIDDLTAKKIAGRFAYIEQINRLATIAESRRNTMLRDIDRRRPRNVKEVEEVEFQLLPAKGQNAA